MLIGIIMESLMNELDSIRDVLVNVGPVCQDFGSSRVDDTGILLDMFSVCFDMVIDFLINLLNTP